MPSIEPNTRKYWDRPVELIMRELPGERVLTPSRMLIIHAVEGFRGLVRTAMAEDYESARKKREPGDVYITSIRGFPLINVTCTTSAQQPEVVWLKAFTEDKKIMKGANIASSIAKDRGSEKTSGKELLDYCMRVLNGTSVLDSKSPLRVIENIDTPPEKRRIYINPQGDAQNSIGIAGLDEAINGITSREQALAILAEEADRIGITQDQLLQPNRLQDEVKRSKILRMIMKFFQTQK